MDQDGAILAGLDDIAEIEREFGLSVGFFDSLIKENDWSLVIKCHALLEAATSRMLTLYFGKRCLNDIFTRMELGNRLTGKAAFISQLELLERPQRAFISHLSELRNQLVHNVANASVSLVELIGSMPANKRENYVEALNVGIESILRDGVTLVGDDIVLKCPNGVIWASTQFCLSSIWIQCVFAEKRHELIAKQLKEVAPFEVDPNELTISLEKLPIR